MKIYCVSKIFELVFKNNFSEIFTGKYNNFFYYHHAHFIDEYLFELPLKRYIIYM